MYDAHYDLLTYIIIKKNDLNFIKELCRSIYREDNVRGGIINLYYMDKDKMKEELNITTISPIEDLIYAKKVIEEFNLLPDKSNFLFGIEGCSYIDINDLDILYSLGLRSINPLYNEDNIYGGGALGNNNRGLTKLGEELLTKAISLGINIDISHCNEKTANDILDFIYSLRNRYKKIIVYASHSNSKELCDISRNLSLETLKNLKKVNGTVGLICRKSFCKNYTKEEIINNKVDYLSAFLKQLDYLIKVIGIDNVMIASDDMSYHKDLYYSKYNAIFNIESINLDLRSLLYLNGYSKEEINKLLIINFKNNILKR